MPKKINYPRTNFKKTLNLVLKLPKSQTVFSVEDIADYTGQAMSGVLTTTISSAVKHDLLMLVPDGVSKSELLISITNNSEIITLVLKAFLAPEAYANIYSRFNGKQIQKLVLEQIFIKDFDCEPKYASRAVKYFIEGLQFMHLIDKNNHLRLLDLENLELNKLDAGDFEVSAETPKKTTPPASSPTKPKPKPLQDHAPKASLPKPDILSYPCHLEGPGISVDLHIQSEQDIAMLEEALHVIKSRIK